MISTNYTLDMTPGAVPMVIHVSQYDMDSRSLVFSLVDSSGTVSLPSGTQAAVRGTKPDGNGFDNTATLAGTTVTVNVTEQMAAVAGKVMCEIYLYKGTYGSSGYQQLATANFILAVERAALDKDTLISGSEIRQLVDIIDRTDEIIAAGTAAFESAGEAEASAIAAADSADDASASATTASEKATAASNSATGAANSALAASGSATSAAVSATLAESWAVGGTSTRTGEDTNNSEYFADLASDDATAAANSAELALNALHRVTITDNPIEITSALNTLPARQVDVTIAAVQAGTGDPSPSNTRAISGVTSVKLTRSGRNFLPVFTANAKNQVTMTVAADGTLTFNGTATEDSWFDVNMDYHIPAGVRFTLCAFNPVKATDSKLNLFVTTVRDDTGGPANTQVYCNNGTNMSTTSGLLTTGIRATKARVRIPSGYQCDNYVIKPMAVIGTTAPTTYEKGGTSVTTISMPTAAGTVYGGKLDVTAGVLTVTHVCDTYTWGAYEGTSTSGDYTRRLFYLSSAPDYDHITDAISSIAPYDSSTSYSPAHFWCKHSSNEQCYVYLPSSTSDSTTFTVCYPLATPVTYSVTAEEVALMEGYNLIDTNAAGISAEVYVNQIQYAANYTDTQIMAAEYGIIAEEYDNTATYAAGQYCMYGGALYRCTEAIETAEAFDADHWELVTVGEELEDIAGDLADLTATYEAANGFTYDVVGPGNPVYADDITGNTAFGDVVLTIDPIQDGSGTPAPDNERAISGTSGDVVLARTGKNILPMFEAQTVNGVTLSVGDDGTITLDGTNTGTASMFYALMDYTIPVGQTWTLSGFNPEAATESTFTVFVYLDSGLNNMQINLDSASATGKVGVKSIPYKLWRIGIRVPAGYECDSFVLKPMIKLGSSFPDAYVAPGYASVTATIPATPGTVYGGEINLTEGTLKVTRVTQTLTWGSGYTSSAMLGGYYRRQWKLSALGDQSARASDLCNVAPYLYSLTSKSTHFYTYKSGGYTCVYVFLPTNTDADTSIQICYTLASPVTYTLDAVELRTIDGYNLLDTSAAAVTASFPSSKLKAYMRSLVETPHTSEQIGDGTVTPEKCTFFETTSFNLINPDNITTALYSSGAGTITTASDSTAFAFTGLIPVTEGESYCYSGSAARFVGGGFYTADAECAAGQACASTIIWVAPVTGDGKYFIVPEGLDIAYVGLNLAKDTSTQEINGDYQLEVGEMATDIVDYEEVTTIKEEYLPSSGSSGGGTTELTGLDTLPRPSYAHLQSRISSFMAHHAAKDKDLVVCGTGTSLTARSSEMSTTRDDATSRPPLLHANNFASKIWDMIAWDGQEYRRFDYAGFFTETGTFTTAASGISDWDDYSYRYGITRYASGTAGVTFTVPVDAWQFNFIYRTDTSGSTAVTVTIDEGDGYMEVYDGSDWVEANNYVFSMLETVVTLSDISIYNPNTVDNTGRIARTSYQVGGNTTYQKRLKMRCKGTGYDSRTETKSVTISSTSGRFMYWGVEWSPRQFMITYINAARGSHNMTAYDQGNENDYLALSHYQDNEIWSFKPDLIFSEIPIHNSGGGGSSGYRLYYYQQYWGNAVYDFFLNADNPVSLAARAAANGVTGLEWVLFNSSLTRNFGGIESDGSLKLLTDNSGNVITCLDAQGLCVQWLRENASNVIAINACKYWVDAARAMFDGDVYAATTGSGAGGSTFSNEGAHWNDLGCAVMARCIGGVFDLYN